MANWKPWFGAAVVCLFFTLLSLGRDRPTFWSADNGVKWRQAKIIAERGIRDSLLDYPQVDLDPEGRYQPLGWKFGRLREDRIVFSTSPYYPMMLAPFAGEELFAPGLFLSAVFAAAVFWMTYRLGVGLEIRFPTIFAFVLVCLTPLNVYAVEANEHLLTLALGLGAFLCVFGRDPDRRSWRHCLAAGVLCGLAGWFRNEYYPWGVALAVAASYRFQLKSSLQILTGVAVLFLVGLVMTEFLTPSAPPLRGVGVHDPISQTSFGAFYMRYRWALLNHWLFSWGHYDEARELSLLHPGLWLSGAFFCFALFFANRSRNDPSSSSLPHSPPPLRHSPPPLRHSPPPLRHSRSLLRHSRESGNPGAVATFFIGALILAVWLQFLRIGYPHASGLFIAFPVTALVLLLPLHGPLMADARTRSILIACGAHLVLALLLVGLSRGGRQWGPRYLMATFPLLAALGWRFLEEAPLGGRRLKAVCVTPILVASLLAGGVALYTVRKQQRELPLDFLQGIQKEHEESIFLTDLDYLPAAAVALGHRHWMAIPGSATQEEREQVVSRILDGRKGFVWISRSGNLPPLEGGGRIGWRRSKSGYTVAIVNR